MGLPTFENGIGERPRNQPNGSDGLVIAWNNVIDIPRITIRIHNGDRRYAQAFGLTEGNAFLARIDGEESIWQAIHRFDAQQEALELLPFLAQLHGFFLGAQIELALRFHVLQLLKSLDALADGGEISEHT